MIPGEIICEKTEREINKNRRIEKISVSNTGDRPIQIGSHYHFYEVNKALEFNRQKAFGMHLDVPSGTAVRFEPGEEKEVQLVEIGGNKRVFGLNGLTQGSIEDSDIKKKSEDIAVHKGFIRGLEGK